MIDQELRDALAVDPSPEFVARVRERIGREETASREWSWWPIAVAIASTIVVVAAVDRTRWQQPAVRMMPPRSATIASTPLPTLGTTIGSSAPKTLRRLVDRAVEKRADRASDPTAAVEPEVLISASEARAIRNFLDGVRDGRIDLSSLPLEASKLDDVVFAPIILPPAGPGEGVRQ